MSPFWASDNSLCNLTVRYLYFCKYYQLPLSLPPSRAHTHTYTQAHTHKHTHTHIHTPTHTHIHTHQVAENTWSKFRTVYGVEKRNDLSSGMYALILTFSLSAALHDFYAYPPRIVAMLGFVFCEWSWGGRGVATDERGCVIGEEGRRGV